MPQRDVVVVGGSAGGVEALRALVSRLPEGLPAAVLVVIHTSPHHKSFLSQVLARAGPLPVQEVRGEETIQRGRVYLAMPNYHLEVVGDRVRSVMGPKENRHRPSVDHLFRSAAHAFGPRLIGVVVSGSLEDGANGLSLIKAAGGVTVVQDPEEASHPSMPLSALRRGVVDHVLDLGQIARLIESLAGSATPPRTRPSPEKRAMEETPSPAPPVAFSCPECNGTLWELRRDDHSRFQCRVGHAFSPESVLLKNGENLERALWTALRILEERAEILQKLAEVARGQGFVESASMHEAKIAQIQKDAATLRAAVAQNVEKHSADE
jgi:two-component system chemotaxis response regulator CheB